MASAVGYVLVLFFALIRQSNGFKVFLPFHPLKTLSSNLHPSSDLLETQNQQSYVVCSNCKSAYFINGSQFGKSSHQMLKCEVCRREWNQQLDKLEIVTPLVQLVEMTDSQNFHHMPRTQGKPSKETIFVGSLPSNYDEKDLGVLFSEYGVLKSSIARTTDGKPRGFGFIELSSAQDAEQALIEMNGYCLDEFSHLVVEKYTSRPKVRIPPSNSPIP